MLISCSNESESKISFYHWKANAKFTPTIENALKQSETQNIYLHYFDIDVVNDDFETDGLYPVYVLKEVDKAYKAYEIIPTVFITNKTFQQELNIENLAQRTSKLIHEISMHHFEKELLEIQIDCDWSASTRESYFQFLELLKKDFEVSTTIRLHQIKYAKETGVPPVSKGVLMLYNMGDLKDFEQNSIISAEITSQYITDKTRYPLTLDIALPLFSQTVLQNLQGEYRLINTTERSLLESNKKHFTQESENVFHVKKDTLYHGYYLSEGYKLKIEESSEEEIIQSYSCLKNSNIKIDGVIFYHLDDPILSGTPLDQIIRAL